MCNLFNSPNKLSHTLGLGAALVVGLLAFGGTAQAANPFELNFWLSGPRYDGNVAPCERALATISDQFHEKEATFWNSPLVITGFSRIHETAFRPWQSDNIPRRYCSGDAVLSDRQSAQGALFDHRGWRLCRHQPGRRLVRRRAGPQLGL
ncbi:hypothetical protein ACVWY2_005060 [Bradyrhizobium sp. JR6.1]